MSHVAVTGATGLIGRALCTRLLARGDTLTVLSRDAATARKRLPGAQHYRAWQPGSLTALDGIDAVVHLAGASIAGQRWTADYKREITESRTRGTRAIVDSIARATPRPTVLVSSSGVDYYGPHGDEIIDEQAAAGSGFLSQVCVAWEAEAQRAAELGVRVAMLRTGIVLDKDEGALAKLLPPFTLGLGGPVPPGTQWWSWIHRDDIVGLYLLLLDDPRAQGPFNGTAPQPERNRDFSTTLGQVLGRPALIPTPLFALDLALGELARPLLVEKQRALPQKALALGYTFRFRTLEPALRDLLRAE